jgi:hypothetical protein
LIARDRFWMTMMPHLAGILIVLATVAWLAPSPQPTDQVMVEHVGRGVINPGCADLNCFRILVPAAVESLPGPSLPRWRAYAVVMNAAAAVATGWLALELGLPAAAMTLTVWLSALGAGSSTVYHPYNADPFVLFLAPVIAVLLLRQRMFAAGIVSTIGIFAKEFAAAPLYVAAAAFVVLFAMANLRIGAQVPDVPSWRYALVATLLIAAAAAWRSRLEATEAID